MIRIRKSPFVGGEEPTAHMITLISAEAERAGTPFTEAEKQILLREWHPETIVPEDLEAKARKLIERTFDHEVDPDDPRSLGNSVMWAADQNYATIAVLTEEVIRARGEKLPRLRGRAWAIDRVQLFGCGFASVILLMLLAAFVEWLFGHH